MMVVRRRRRRRKRRRKRRKVMAAAMAFEPDHSKWNVIYPIYINSKKTLAEGRKISKSKAVENPTVNEIYDCCLFLKLPCHVEPDKCYSRDYMQRGRLRVQVKSDGVPLNPAIPNRQSLLVEVAKLVPKHANRTRKQQESASASSSGPEVKKSGKGGKKKNR
eukprot:TRINITY_DN1586_c0_g2_i2.p1 TRINITY_DN1586_c0_g2~~TRINITY_DN1586_c0_g2_i2.p1  ORF type:complete len:162 (+),score=37.50 TRINITY_DN1586_c0_g2_i2:24-509(+)